MQFSSSLKLDELIIYFQKQLQITLSKHMGVIFKTNAKKVWLQNYHCIVIDVILPGLEVFKDGLGLRIKEKNYGFWLARISNAGKEASLQIDFKGNEFGFQSKSSELLIENLMENMTAKILEARQKGETKAEVMHGKIVLEFVDQAGRRIIFETDRISINV